MTETLSPSGREVAGLVSALVSWIEDHLFDVLASRECTQVSSTIGG
jgi:hypothetical protein